MKIARLDDAEIAFLDEGQGKPVLLIHGFGSTAMVNWSCPGWVRTLTDEGYRVIALDNRGHGKSSKYYDSADYDPDKMAGDALSLLDHLNIDKVHVVGYSMGSRIAAFVAFGAADRVNRLVFGGMGDNLVKGVGRWKPIAAALEADDLESICDPTGLKFRLFADQTGSDRRALAACIRPSRRKITGAAIADLTHPVLVAVGSDDDVAGSGKALADMLPNGRHLIIPGRDHMKAVGDKVFKQGVVGFFAEDEN